MILSPALESDPSVRVAMERHLDRVRSEYPNEIVGVFLVGSQNYGLATEQSDVDTRALVLPTFQQIALNKEPVSKELSFEDGGKCVVRDVRLVFRELLKQNPNCLEILCTSYYILNEKYAGYFYSVLQHANQIARYCPRLFVKSVYGMICSNAQKLRSALSAAHKEAVYTPTLTKPLVAIIRMVDMLEAYMKDCPFSGCLMPSDPVDLLRLKHTPAIGSGYIYNSLESLTCAARDLVCRADKEFAGVIDDRIPIFLDATLINLLRLSISSDPTYKEAPHE